MDRFLLMVKRKNTPLLLIVKRRTEEGLLSFALPQSHGSARHFFGLITANSSL
jgi:hypothetical protein